MLVAICTVVGVRLFRRAAGRMIRLVAEPWARRRKPATHSDARVLKRDDVHTGLSLMQTVYSIAIVLGFKKALEPAYEVLVYPRAASASHLSRGVVLVTLVALALIGLRFFWVPRNLYAYVLRSKLEMRERMRRMTLVHFPVVLLHAAIFYGICAAYSDLTAKRTREFVVPSATHVAALYIAWYAFLLLINAFWLLTMAWRRDARAERLWGINNFLTSVAAWIVFLGLQQQMLSPAVALYVASGLFIFNSGIDLWGAAEDYILFPDVGSSP